MRLVTPPPHVFVQTSQLLQLRIVHLMGHLPMLHLATRCVEPHAFPLWAAAVMIGRVRNRVPPAHVFVHVLHSVHLPATQSTGQESPPHVPTSSVASHGLPLCRAARSI